MARITLKELNLRIQAENEKFVKLPNTKKRVRIAQDCLARIELGQINPQRDALVKTPLNFEYKPIKEFLANEREIIKCEACAKGGLLLAYVGRVNELTFPSYGFSNFADNSAHAKLLEVFDLRQLALIEMAFEGRKYIETVSLSPDTEAKAETFYSTYQDPTERLKAICENIIANGGTFTL